jgi:hypothetical protein
MRKLSVYGLTLGLAMMAATAAAAPNVANATQKGSLLVWPDIRVDNGWTTLVRIQNDGISDVDIVCYWMDGNKNRTDVIFPLTANAAIWFDAKTGNGSFQVNPFPQGPANGFDNPFLITPPATTEAGDDPGPFPGGALQYPRGMLVCWVVDGAGIYHLKWNHISGTATVWNPAVGAYEYNAYAFFVPTGADLAPVCAGPAPCVPTPQVLNLNGVEYDQCPQYLMGQFTPEGIPLAQVPSAAFPVIWNRLALTGCFLNLNQDWSPVFTKLEFEVWNEDERKFTGAFECADTWHETKFNASPTARSGGWVDSGAQVFQFATLGTYSARWRVHAEQSAQCERPATTNPPSPAIATQPTGLLGVQSTLITLGTATEAVGSTVAVSGKMTGRIVADPGFLPPEGGIR